MVPEPRTPNPIVLLSRRGQFRSTIVQKVASAEVRAQSTSQGSSWEVAISRYAAVDHSLIVWLEKFVTAAVSWSFANEELVFIDLRGTAWLPVRAVFFVSPGPFVLSMRNKNNASKLRLGSQDNLHPHSPGPISTYASPSSALHTPTPTSTSTPTTSCRADRRNRHPNPHKPPPKPFPPVNAQTLSRSTCSIPIRSSSPTCLVNPEFRPLQTIRHSDEIGTPHPRLRWLRPKQFFSSKPSELLGILSSHLPGGPYLKALVILSSRNRTQDFGMED
ncbi:hypothetical protein CSAL01_12255 [Colletotrichum salicis]|uniref:Uncharacterized protein n=1 Tax=Colletotrichum salicis TaxID=1209931 RepID=A0A135V3P5_9PEZI|nr:hypothetical protein CSAL01_12255 [Colletotrichum salicis]